MIFRVVKYVLGILLGIPLTVSGQESPPGGVSLIGGDFLTSFKLYSGSAAATKQEKTITGQSFRKVAELSTHKETSNFWGAEYSTPLTRPVEKAEWHCCVFIFVVHPRKMPMAEEWFRPIVRRHHRTGTSL